MDHIVIAAVDEVCAQAANGMLLVHLWPRLQNSLSSAGLHLCNGVKRVLWSRILASPGLQFHAGGSWFDPRDPTIQSVEEAERLSLKIVAADKLRDNFLGIYDLRESTSELTPMHRRVLERLAVARTNGITQNELAKELGLEGNKIFYILKSLESRQLIVRRSSIVRTKEMGKADGLEAKSNSVIRTNLVHLYRFAKHLKMNAHQRVEMTKTDFLDPCHEVEGNNLTEDDAFEECSRKDVFIKSFLPDMKAVCKKLEEANDKVLVVSDIKQTLGYRRTQGHRAWRNICNRLKDALLVEEFCAEVNGKVVTCLRLLKKFDPQKVFLKGSLHSCDNSDIGKLAKSGKRGRTTNELVELPIEQQMYDMVDAAGSKGMTLDEVRKQLGLSNKRYYNRIVAMFKRFGCHLQPESHKTLAIYRVWTPQNFNPVSSNTETPDENNISMRVKDQALHQQSDNSEGEFNLPIMGGLSTMKMASESQQCSPENGQLVIHSGDYPSSGNEVACGGRSVLPHAAAAQSDSTAVRPDSMASSSTPLKHHTLQKNRADCIQREQRVLEKLQDEKFIVTADLYRWLENLEKEKPTTMARKTLTRLLNKLQQKGLCRCITVTVPVLTNCGRSRTTEVVLHPSIGSLSPELIKKIYERLRLFEMQIRGQGLNRLNNDQPVPVLTSVSKTSNCIDRQVVKVEAIRANGFIPAKMIRAKMLHLFLWHHTSNFSDSSDVAKGKSSKPFVMDTVLKAMPLELFLQVVGSAENCGDVNVSCRRGLCLSDLPLCEYKCLISNSASERLSRLIDILSRLKLIRLVTDGHVGAMGSCIVLVYAMDLEPYIEEPLSKALPSSCVNHDLRPRIRHDFNLSTKEAVDNYWSILEYCYSTADPSNALQAFPGSAVHELYHNRSWASVRVMTTKQRLDLMRRISNVDPHKKIAYRDCNKIANDLNLSLEQVLRVYYDKLQPHIRRSSRASKSQVQDCNTKNPGLVDGKTETFLRMNSDMFTKSANEVNEASETAIQSPLIIANDDASKFEQAGISTLLGTKDSHLPSLDEEIHVSAEEEDANEDGQNYSINILHHSIWPKSTCRNKFSWTEKSDRQLVMQYASYRAFHGPKFHRVDWSSVPDLPAPADSCRRRMCVLNSNAEVRLAVMKLCNVLRERYAEHSIKTKDIVNYKGCASSTQEDCWNNFEDPHILMLVDEVFKCKKMMKPETSRSKKLEARFEKVCSSHSEVDGRNLDTLAPELGRFNEYFARPLSLARKRSNRPYLPQKFIKRLDDKDVSFSRKGYSLGIANALELLKVAFLSTSSAPSLLAATLRCYSEQDLLAAFSILKERKFMVIGHGSRPFVLSQKFWHDASSSPFPVDTGKRAVDFANWLHEREKDLMENGINLSADVQCGDVFHLCALISSEELSISPCLPIEGIGEVDELASNCDLDEGNDRKVKKQRKHNSVEDSEFYRREKGFPGIVVSIRRIAYSRAKSMELFINDDCCSIPSLEEKTCLPESLFDVIFDGSPSSPNISNQSPNVGSIVPAKSISTESNWEAINSYAKLSLPMIADVRQDVPLSPLVFESVYNAIHKAGEQGLNMFEISKVAFAQGEQVVEAIVDALRVFGLVLKVNDYDCTRVVDSSFGSKYFLYTIPDRSKGDMSAYEKSHLEMDNTMPLSKPLNDNENASGSQEIINVCDGHKITILDAPDVNAKLHSEAHSVKGGILSENLVQIDHVAAKGSKSESFSSSSHLPAFRPILPWMNADGTMNNVVYKSLRRRAFGIVMQNPGMMEADLVCRMAVLNPQSCRKLLELLVLDNHLILRKMHQTTSGKPPSILGSILKSGATSTQSMFCKHYFANPMSTSLL